MDPVTTSSSLAATTLPLSGVGLTSLQEYYELLGEIEENATVLAYPADENLVKALAYLQERFDSLRASDSLDYRNLVLLKCHLIDLNILCEQKRLRHPEAYRNFLTKIEEETTAIMPRLGTEDKFLGLPEIIILKASQQILDLAEVDRESIALQVKAFYDAVDSFSSSIMSYENKQREILLIAFRDFFIDRLKMVYEKVEKVPFQVGMQIVEERGMAHSEIDSFSLSVFHIHSKCLRMGSEEGSDHKKLEYLYFLISRGTHPSQKEFDDSVSYLRKRFDTIPIKADIFELRELRGFRFFFDNYLERRRSFGYLDSEELLAIDQQLLIRIEVLASEVKAPEDLIEEKLKEIILGLPDPLQTDFKTGKPLKPLSYKELQEYIYPFLTEIYKHLQDYKALLEMHSEVERRFLLSSLRTVLLLESCAIYVKWSGMKLRTDVEGFKEAILNLLKTPQLRCEAMTLGMKILHPIFFQWN